VEFPVTKGRTLTAYCVCEEYFNGLLEKERSLEENEEWKKNWKFVLLINSAVYITQCQFPNCNLSHEFMGLYK